MILPESIMHFKVKKKTLVVCGMENIYIYDINHFGSELLLRLTIALSFAPARIDFNESFIFTGTQF